MKTDYSCRTECRVCYGDEGGIALQQGKITGEWGQVGAGACSNRKSRCPISVNLQIGRQSSRAGKLYIYPRSLLNSLRAEYQHLYGINCSFVQCQLQMSECTG